MAQTSNEKLDKDVSDFRDEFEIAADFCRPQFELAAIHYALWR